LFVVVLVGVVAVVAIAMIIVLIMLIVMVDVGLCFVTAVEFVCFGFVAAAAATPLLSLLVCHLY